MEYMHINCGKEDEEGDDDGAKSINEFRSMFDKWSSIRYLDSSNLCWLRNVLPPSSPSCSVSTLRPIPAINQFIPKHFLLVADYIRKYRVYSSSSSSPLPGMRNVSAWRKIWFRRDNPGRDCWRIHTGLAHPTINHTHTQFRDHKQDNVFAVLSLAIRL